MSFRALPSAARLLGARHFYARRIHPPRSQVCDKLGALSAKCDLRTRNKLFRFTEKSFKLIKLFSVIFRKNPMFAAACGGSAFGFSSATSSQQGIFRARLFAACLYTLVAPLPKKSLLCKSFSGCPVCLRALHYRKRCIHLFRLRPLVAANRGLFPQSVVCGNASDYFR